MFNLEKAIKEWKKSLRKNEALEDGYIAELECHLRDEYEDGIKNGKTDENSFIDAVKEVGDANTLGEAYYKIDTTHRIKRPPWKESKWFPSLLSNYLKVARRNLFNQKGRSFINVAGLALGMACAILLLLWINHQQSFDKFHKNAKNLYKLIDDQKTPQGIFHWDQAPEPAGPTIKDNIPGVKDVSRFYQWQVVVKYGNNKFVEKEVFLVDSSFFNMFSFQLIQGNPATALSQPFSAVISETMAKKYFGNENPIGKILAFNGRMPISVTGVIKDAPQNSSLKPEILIPFDITKKWGVKPNWSNFSYPTFIQLGDEIQINEINKKITRLLTEKLYGDEIAGKTQEQIEEFISTKAVIFKLMPITDINLYGYTGYNDNSALINSFKIFLLLTLFILIIASINYMNLATAKAACRAKEIGLRKTVGAEKRHIIIQFFSESVLTTFISFFFSFVIAILLLPLFNELVGTEFTTWSLFNLEFLLLLLFVVLCTGIISGIYPALFLSSFNPVSVLKGNLTLGTKSKFFRKSLVVFQFSLSVILLISTIVAFQQSQFMRSKNVGYEKEHLIYFQLAGFPPRTYEALKVELSKNPNVLNFSAMQWTPTNIKSSSDGADWEGKDPNYKPLIAFDRVKYNYIETMKIKMAEGRPFLDSFPSDSTSGFLVNEEVLKIMGVKSGVGKSFHFLGMDGQIIGVMKNFQFAPGNKKIEPLALAFTPTPVYALARLKVGNIPGTIASIKSVWDKIITYYPFDYKFVDEDFEAMYKTDEQMESIFKYGAAFAIVIACLGLFGFASYMAEKRTKEIGIRKTLGASTSGITVLLTKEFVKWVLIANVIAWPVAYVLMNNWLQDYAYRISIQWWVFPVAGFGTVLIALLTVGYQAVRSATANPVNSLRSE